MHTAEHLTAQINEKMAKQMGKTQKFACELGYENRTRAKISKKSHIYEYQKTTSATLYKTNFHRL